MIKSGILNSKQSIKLSLIENMQPLNIEEEKAKFFFDNQYNPQFEYQKTIDHNSLAKHGTVDERYTAAAQKIVQEVLEQYESETNFLKSRGRILEKNESLKIINEYLKRNQISNLVRVRTSSSYTARTSLKRDKTNFILRLRLPIRYREKGIIGMLNHEIGTHFYRWINEINQPWFENKSQYQLSKNYLLTEEGLATTNSLLPLEKPFLWSAALNYLLVIKGSQMSFSQLNQWLKQYVLDQDRRWNMCLKIKRGVEDTSLPLVFTKNQIYLKGVMQILAWLSKHNFDPSRLYLGKITHNDVDRAATLAEHQPVLPDFIKDRGAYSETIIKIIETNKLNHLLKKNN